MQKLEIDQSLLSFYSISPTFDYFPFFLGHFKQLFSCLLNFSHHLQGSKITITGNYEWSFLNHFNFYKAN